MPNAKMLAGMLLVAFLVFFAVKLVPVPPAERDTQKYTRVAEIETIQKSMVTDRKTDFPVAIENTDEQSKVILAKLYDRLEATQKSVVKSYPAVLPAMLVAPQETEEAVNGYGTYAVSYIMHHTPDSYSTAAKTVRDQGSRMIAIQNILSKNSDGLPVNKPAMDNFITQTVTKHLDLIEWLEPRLGLEQTLFLVANCGQTLVNYETEIGKVQTKGILYSLQGYAQSRIESQREIADICCTVPKALDIFIETRRIPTLGDSFLAQYGKRGGVALLNSFDKKLWEKIVRSSSKIR